MKFPVVSSLVRRVGLDLGSETTRIWTDREGVIFQQPSCVAIDQSKRKVMAVGSEAAAMDGRVASHIQVIHPIQNGMVHDSEMATTMVRLFLLSIMKRPFLLRPVMMVAVPSGSTAAQRQAMTDVLLKVGASEVYTMTQPLAAAIGAGVPIADASGTFLLHLGHGLAQAAVISLGSTVASRESFQAGHAVQQQLQQHIQSQVGLKVSQAMVKRLLAQVATVNLPSARQLLTAGQDMTTNSPRELTLTAELLYLPIRNVVDQYVSLLKDLLSAIPPELTVDVIDKGMLVSGGMAQLDGLESAVVQQLGVAVTVVDEPDLAVVKGLGVALENIELLKESLGYQ